MLKVSTEWFTTSVQNHLLQLNGNNFIIVLILLLVMSCGGSKKASKSNTPIEIFNASKANAKKIDSIKLKDEINNDSISKSIATHKKEIQDPFSLLKDKSPKKKLNYSMVCILPFNAGEIWKIDLSQVDNIIGKEPKQTLQYFEGMYLAIQDWNTKGLNLNIQLYDNKKQDSLTKTILDKIDLKNPPDILVAPFHTKQAQIVAEFAKANKIPCFLPYNPSEKISNNNPYLFKINPSLISLYKKIIQEKMNGEDSADIKFHFVFKDNVKGEADIAKAIEKFTQSKIDTTQLRPNNDPKKMNFIVTNKGMRIMENIVRGRKNIYLIPSADDRYINTLLTHFKSSKDYSFEIYGVPSWENSELLDKRTLETKNAKIYTDYYVGDDSTKFHSLNKKYIKLYGEELNDDVIRGFDFMNFIASNVEKYGTSFPFAIQEHEYIGIGTNYLFKPIIDKKGNIDNYENMMQYKLELLDERWIMNENKK